jgi:hypothetical protein
MVVSISAVLDFEWNIAFILPQVEPRPSVRFTTYAVENTVYYVLTYQCTILVLIKENYGWSLRNVSLHFRQLSVEPENQLICQSWEL